MKETKKKIVLRGMRNAIPIALAYLAVSFAIGIKASQTGFDALAAGIMSLTNVASAGEYNIVTLVAAGAGLWELALSQFVINARYFLMSCSLSQKIPEKTPWYQRLLIGYGITDEMFALAVVEEKYSPYYSFGMILTSIPGWILGTVLGVLSGELLPAILVSALGMALYGMFCSIIITPARKSPVIAVLVPVSMACSFAFTVIPGVREISEGLRIIILTVVLATLAAVFFPIREEANDAPAVGKGGAQ